ncbi:hypothetical protein GBAR_LOCUS26925, partial [Geodia barretti]
MSSLCALHGKTHQTPQICQGGRELFLCSPVQKTEGDGVGAEEVPGDISRDTEHPLSVTAVTLCSVESNVRSCPEMQVFTPAVYPLPSSYKRSNRAFGRTRVQRGEPKNALSAVVPAS